MISVPFIHFFGYFCFWCKFHCWNNVTLCFYTTLSLNCGRFNLSPHFFRSISHLYFVIRIRIYDIHPFSLQSCKWHRLFMEILLVKENKKKQYTHECCHRYDKSYWFHWQIKFPNVLTHQIGLIRTHTPTLTHTQSHTPVVKFDSMTIQSNTIFNFDLLSLSLSLVYSPILSNMLFPILI